MKLSKRKQLEYKWAKHRTVCAYVSVVFAIIGLFVSCIILTILINK